MFIGIYPVYTGPDNSYAVLVYHTRTSYVNIIVYLESLRNEDVFNVDIKQLRQTYKIF